MKFKPYWSLIPLSTVLVAGLGSYFSANGMDWYDTVLITPEGLTPDKWVFPVAWNLIFIATTLSALLIWNKSKRDARFKWIMGLFGANAVLNVAWNALFFGMREIQIAFIEMLFLEASILALLILNWKISKTASALLLPYLAWVGFASFLTYQILLFNS